MSVVVSEKLTSRMYDGMRVRSRSFKGVCEKTEGFDSAAVAIMHECAPYDPTPESVADSNYPKRRILTSQFLDSNCILCANAVTVSDDSDTFTHPFDEFHNLLQTLNDSSLVLPHVSRSAVHSERTHSRVHNPLH